MRVSESVPPSIGDAAVIGAKANNAPPQWAAVIRSVDVLIAALVLLLIFPLLIIIAISIKYDTRGPIIFRQTRYGRDRIPFSILKFRTMTVQEDGSSFRQAVVGDPRVTRVGRFLRASSLDELPQLWNVIRGDMSLVGPRPHPTALDDSLCHLVANYDARFKVRPGLTGLAQIRGFRGPTVTAHEVEGRIGSDLEFVERQSMALYLRVLVLTLPALLRGAKAF